MLLMIRATQTRQDDRDEWTKAANAKIGEVLSSESVDHTSQRDGSTEGVCWRTSTVYHLTGVFPVTSTSPLDNTRSRTSNNASKSGALSFSLALETRSSGQDTHGTPVPLRRQAVGGSTTRTPREHTLMHITTAFSSWVVLPLTLKQLWN